MESKLAHNEKTIKTLGEKVTPEIRKKPFRFTFKFTVACVAGLGVWWALDSAHFGLVTVLVCMVFFTFRFFGSQPSGEPNFLVEADQQGFISNLKLADKTAIFDGHNIYHFGIAKKIGSLPLGALIAALRSEGYRIVCFFDNNIYFTLKDNGDFPTHHRRHSTRILYEVFD